ncbi:DNA excision repair protein ERCC-6 [Phytophthora pseudosyringae]|uniref:DNA excision repair protein ERCC-6 n=1 Tax=Phytophthora pseudosyringae TaxID=221518 RepID=A0A8T1W2N6_9STRA|nr:DNA excision repair protein ERCC-6 [Phytophthora pseudosyringae]
MIPLPESGRGEEETESGEALRSGGNRVNADVGDNDAVLKQLFDGGDVRGVLDRPTVESDGVQNREADLVEMDATKIAQVSSAVCSSRPWSSRGRERGGRTGGVSSLGMLATIKQGAMASQPRRHKLSPDLELLHPVLLSLLEIISESDDTKRDLFQMQLRLTSSRQAKCSRTMRHAIRSQEMRTCSFKPLLPSGVFQ